MISINTAKFEFSATNETFARNLNLRWESRYQPVFEQVTEEVLSYYNRPTDTLIIESLPLRLGNLNEENFDTQFPVRLREALHEWFRQLPAEYSDTATNNTFKAGIKCISLEQSRFDILCFFLLHGYLPSTATHESGDISFLLKAILDNMADEFREFLERYAHYDFLYKRLVLQFTDDELEALIEKSQPSESKFINLYARIQIQYYKKKETAAITFSDYRNAVWILVLTYLFTETGGRFNRKQLVIHTLRGLSARFNLTYTELVNLLSEKIKELEIQVVQLPELWDILKEIRRDIHEDLMSADTSYIHHTIREIVYTLRFGNNEDTAYLLSPDNLGRILSEPENCRLLLLQLYEKEIYHLIEIIIPAESAFINEYARLLDKHNENNSFRGKAGNEFRILKWEFIFQVLYHAPLSVFNRQQFVLSVIQKLASHYNLTVEEVISFLFSDEEINAVFSNLNILPVLAELKRQFIGTPANSDNIHISLNELPDVIAVLENPLTARKFLMRLSEREIHHIVHLLIPSHSDFIYAYSRVLDNYAGKGSLAGKSGNDFESLKWEFIFSYILSGNRTFFERKYFVYSVLQQLANHYNQSVTDLLGYFVQEFNYPVISHVYTELHMLLKELQAEILLPLIPSSVGSRMKPDAIEYWILNLFGKQSAMAHQRKEFMEKWLIYLLDNYSGSFRSLWKEGKLNSTYILSLVNSKSIMQYLWVRRIGDLRVQDIWIQWDRYYSQLRHEHPDLFVLQSLAAYIRTWMIQLTAREYSGWSEKEIEHFLMQRIRQALPIGEKSLLKEKYSENKTNVKLILKVMEDKNQNTVFESGNEPIQVENAGVMLMGPFMKMLFKRLNYLDDSSKFFKGDQEKMRAIFLLQFLIYDQEKEYNESELVLNKLLVDWMNNSPLPRSLSLTEEEKKMTVEVLNVMRQNWPKLRNSSNKAVQMAFFERRGTITKSNEREEAWEIKVEEKPYDMLLDSLDWNFTIQRNPWSDYLFFVKWRQR